MERDRLERGGGRRRGSDQFPLPTWQANAGVPAGRRPVRGRGVPDVAGNADPTTGYQIMSDGKSQVVGGTSAVAPLWSALIARLAQATGQRFGLIQTALYAGISPGSDVPGFRDITSGNNGAYSAGPGWDACSGLGSPTAPTADQDHAKGRLRIALNVARDLANLSLALGVRPELEMIFDGYDEEQLPINASSTARLCCIGGGTRFLTHGRHRDEAEEQVPAERAAPAYRRTARSRLAGGL